MASDQMALRPERGRFLRPFHTGIFIRDHLSGKGPFGSPIIDPKRGAATEDVRYAYKSALLREYAEDMVAMAMEKGIELSVEEALERIPKRLTKMRSHSFYRYFHHLKMLGWVEPTGEEEKSAMGGMPGARVKKGDKGTLVEVPQPRRFYRLTAKGKAASDIEWQDPLQTLYNYPREVRSPKPVKYRHPGSLPRRKKGLSPS
jgi:hypothetical protein